jgi:murein DD-endopeptidase MepM/ murein hydrolase activator NlpD
MDTSLAPRTAHPPPPWLMGAVCLLVAAVLGLNQSTARGGSAAGHAGVSAGGSGHPAVVRTANVVAPVERFHWPLEPPHPVLRPFQPPTTPYGPGHRGVDLGAPPGAPVFAAGSGLVLYAGPLADRSLVSIEHAGGLRTTYEPVTPAVQVGQYVRRGQVIGSLLPGHPGCRAVAPTVCLHWGAHRGRVYLDPLRLVQTGRVRLLPWPAGVP